MGSPPSGNLATHPWARAGALTLHLSRPLLLVPITVVKLTSDSVLGFLPGLALAMASTLASASIGFGIGRLLGSIALVAELPTHWAMLLALRRHGFESAVAGGPLYVHADAVSFPADLRRSRVTIFLTGIAIGNTLTMILALLAGSSVEGSLGSPPWPSAAPRCCSL